MSDDPRLSPVLFIPHGGGLQPLLDDPGHRSLIDFLQDIPAGMSTPSAISFISGHWKESIATVTSEASPSLIYEYDAFPDSAYPIRYPAPGSPRPADKIHTAWLHSGIPAHLNGQRGFDHGLFVPLKLMFPEAGIP